MSAIANTTFGTVVGNSLAGDVGEFLGIPFAEPPMGSLRFADPVDWSAPFPDGHRQAQSAGSICVQPESAYSHPFRWVGSEDCLYLNVWTPLVQRGGPVLLFVHGGELITGDGSQYNGSQLAVRHGCTVVTMNYRLNDLGWAFLGPHQANFGLKDQRSAMRRAY